MDSGEDRGSYFTRAWVTANAPSLSLANYQTTLPVGAEVAVCLRLTNSDHTVRLSKSWGWQGDKHAVAGPTTERRIRISRFDEEKELWLSFGISKRYRNSPLHTPQSTTTSIWNVT